MTITKWLPWIPGFKRETSWSTTDYSLLCRELRMLIQAGMTVVEALEVLSVSGAVYAGQPNELAQLLYRELSRGIALSDAVATLPGVPQVLPAAIRAGERTSNLAEALDDYLRFDDLVGQLKSKAVNAAIYPGIVASLGIGISIFLLLVVLPNFSRMYASIRGPVSPTATLMMALSHFAVEFRTDIALTTLLLMTMLIYATWSGELMRQFHHLASKNNRLALRIHDFHLAMVYQALALLLRGGYPVAQSLDIAAEASTSAGVAQALRQVRLRVESGKSVSESLHVGQLCDEVSRRLLFSAERNGQFDRAADTVSRIYRTRFELFIDRLTRIIEPVLLIMVALVVGSLVIMMYLPIIEISTQVR